MFLVAVLPVLMAIRLSICVWAEPHIESKAVALGHSVLLFLKSGHLLPNDRVKAHMC